MDPREQVTAEIRKARAGGMETQELADLFTAAGVNVQQVTPKVVTGLTDSQAAKVMDYLKIAEMDSAETVDAEPVEETKA